MMKNAVLSGFALYWAISGSLAAEEAYDVVVYGGTPGGVTAAVAAARHGAGVILLEQKRHVGGLSTSGLVNDELHHMHAWSVTGLARDFYIRLGKAYGSQKWMHRWESKVAEEVFDGMLKEAGVPVRYRQRVAKVQKHGPRIRRIAVLDGSTVAGKVFIDCTYEGDLMARAGVEYTWGRESTEKYGESLAGVRLLDAHHAAGTRDAHGNLLPGINATIDELNPGRGDRKVQNFNFRLCLTQRQDIFVPIPKPENYHPNRYRLLANYLAAHPQSKLRDIIAIYGGVNGKREMNNRQNAIWCAGDFGGQFDYPDADYAAQDRIYRQHVDYTKGLLWFLGHDLSVPGPLRKEMLSWGLAADEFVDNGHWPYYLYVREARRMLGRYLMTQHDIQTRRTKPDSICLGSHYIDAHHVQCVAVSDDKFTNEGRLWVPGKVYEIPYRSITPKEDQCDNLLVPVASSFSHVAFCAYRLEPTWMGTGHAAGVAAAVAAKTRTAVQELDVTTLQKRLSDDGQLMFLSQGPKPDQGVR